MAKAPVRLTRGKLAWEISIWILLGLWIIRFLTWWLRRLKPILYHPYGMLGIAVFWWSYATSPWLVAVLMWALLVWQRVWPYSYRRIAHDRIVSFFVGFKYRYRPRRKLGSCGLLDEKDPVPTISWVTKIGCVTKIRIKMTDGDSIEYWRNEDRPNRIAQTYNAGDLKINPYRRDNFLTLRPNKLDSFPFVQFTAKERTDKWRWLELEFMTKNPFNTAVGFEYIDFHRERGPLQEVGRPVGPMRDGRPYLLNTRTHLLCIAMSGRGKSNAERAMVYAEYEDVLAGYVENWIFDGKRGTEAKPMAHCFARIEDGRNGVEAVAQFVEEVESIMYRRLDEMNERGENLFVPDPFDDNPLMRKLLRFYIDEIMIFETVAYQDVRSRIYKSIAAIQLQGRAAGISIRAFAQNPKLDRLPMRDDFPEIQIGGLQNRRQIDTAMAGGYDLGAREIPEDLPGVFYVKLETAMALEQIRYAHDRDNAIKRLQKCPESVFSLSIEQQKEAAHEVMIA